MKFMGGLHDREFNRLYAEKIRPLEEEWLRERKASRLYASITLGLAALAVLGVALFVRNLRADLWDFLKIAVIVVLPFLFIYKHGVVGPFRSAYKRICVKPMAGLFGLSYSSRRCVPMEEFERSQLFPGVSYNKYGGEDYFYGTCGATEIQFSEIHVRRVTQSGKRKSETTVFRGLMIAADFHKHFRARTWVMPDVGESVFGALGRALQSVNPLKPGELVVMEDAEFERHFAVYADDQVEARYILSPLLMERMVAFKKRNNVTMRASFVGSKVYLALSTGKDLFEASLWSDMHLKAETKLLCGEILFALSIVDALNLNTRIWTKE